MIRQLFLHKGVRFLFVGGLNTLVGLGSYALLVYLGVYFLLANLISFALGVCHSFLWNKFFTFRSKERSLSELLRFTVVYGLSFVVSNFALYLMVIELRLNTYLSGIINVLIITCISWFGHNFFSFKNKQQGSDVQSQTPAGNNYGGPNG